MGKFDKLSPAALNSIRVTGIEFSSDAAMISWMCPPQDAGDFQFGRDVLWWVDSEGMDQSFTRALFSNLASAVDRECFGDNPIIENIAPITRKITVRDIVVDTREVWVSWEYEGIFGSFTMFKTYEQPGFVVVTKNSSNPLFKSYPFIRDLLVSVADYLVYLCGDEGWV